MAPLAIWDFSKFENLTTSPVQGANIRHRAKYFVLIGQTFVELWPFSDFSKWRPSAI